MIPTSPWYYLYDSVHLPRSERISRHSKHVAGNERKSTSHSKTLDSTLSKLTTTTSSTHHPSIAEFVCVTRIISMNVHNCKKTVSLHPPTTTMMDPHKTANTNHNPKGGMTINKGVGTPTNNLNTANPITTTIHHKIPKTQDTNLHIVGNHTNQTTTPNPLMKKLSDLVNMKTRK
ncbi:hypothetical protein PIB30_057129 [Stylosanthes scabra]|uniref:Uncharacterized protein n=1 Tax=Stylosanthes scabra TaxID=79078 RepID=A0ABU6SJK5_9FABA|nr:hypothetical protein [Stylosanthes scabra]